MYKYTPSSIADFKFISGLSSLVTEEQIELYHGETDELTRSGFDGVLTLIGTVAGAKVGIVYTDFRVNGGSFAKNNSQRTGAFVQDLDKKGLPLVFVINSLGVRFMEGRTVFDSAFGVIADLYKFRQNNLLITVGLNKALGISALFFAQGHYRLALEGETLLNLTGPEVHKKFFGKVDADFSVFNLADHQFEVNSLIHTILPSQQMLLRATQDLLRFLFSTQRHSQKVLSASHIGDSEQGGLVLRQNETEKLGELEAKLGESVVEVFEQRSPIVRTYIGKVHGKLVGYLVNPPGHPNNMLTVGAIDKCIAAMDLFKALKLPVICFLDCPGGDPRKTESDKDAIMKMIQLTHTMIAYPFRKMGIVMGRCFGGSGMFAFPKIYDGQKTIAVRGAQVGVMHKSIIEELLKGAPRLKEQWNQVSETEVANLEDLIAIGTIDKVIEKEQIAQEIMQFLIVDELFNEATVVRKQDKNEKFNTYIN